MSRKPDLDRYDETEHEVPETHRLRSMIMVLVVAAIATIGLRQLVGAREA